MKKKLFIALPVCAVFAALLGFLLLFKGSDTLTVFQKSNVEHYLASNPFIDEESGDIVRSVAVAAANESQAAQADSFLWFRNRYDSAASHVELNIAFDTDGRAYLADSFDSVTDDSVPFERVLTHVVENGDEETGFVINLCEYTALGNLAAGIEKLGLQYRTVVTGVNENSLPTVKRYFSKTPVLCDYGTDTKSSLETLMSNGADGIICSFDVFSVSLLNEARALGLQVWVDCESDVYATLTSLYYCVDGIVSSNPDMATFALESWGETLLDEIVCNFYEE